VTDFEVHLAGGAPVYQQIVEQVKRGIAVGKLSPSFQLPTVRDLAERLGVNPSTVAKAYAELERQGVIVTRRGGGSLVAGQTDDRFLASLREERLSGLVGRTVLEALSLGFEPEEVEASFALHIARWRESRTRRPAAAPERAPVGELGFVGSHDLAVELLFSQLRRQRPDLTLSTTYAGSLAGLIALQQGEAQLAGSHLLDEETGEYNLPYVRRLFVGQEVAVVVLVERQQGLMVAKGNPLSVSGLGDLSRPGLRFVNRQRGSGTRTLLDLSLRRLGIAPSAIQGYEREEETHLGVASAIANGDADVGLGIFAAARALGLDFLPLQRERYDLVISRVVFATPELAALLAVVRGEEYRRVVGAMGGYDVARAGEILL